MRTLGPQSRSISNRGLRVVLWQLRRMLLQYEKNELKRALPSK